MGAVNVAECMTLAGSAQTAYDHLKTVDDAWAAVCAFYVAYHHVKAAFLEDPIFDNIVALGRSSLGVTPADRYSTRHKRRAGDKVGGLGVSDLVKALYPEIATRYARLHSASISVRYEGGLDAILLQTVAEDLQFVLSAYSSGKLKAAAV